MPTPREMMEAAKRREAEERARQQAAGGQQREAQATREAPVAQPERATQRQQATPTARATAQARPQQRAAQRQQQPTQQRTAQRRQGQRAQARPAQARAQAQAHGRHASAPSPSSPSVQAPSARAASPERPHNPRSRQMRAYITRWRMAGVAAFGVIMAIGSIVGLLFFARPTTSAVEMRNLTEFPAFTVESFLDGSYFTQVSLWYADTYPLREPMVAADHAIDSLFGVNTGTGMVGGNVQADEIPVQEEEDVVVKPVVVTPPAAVPDSGTVAEDIQANIMSGIFVQDGSGYAIYYFSQDAADTYITAMNTAAEQLDGVATVYSIMAPANSITLSDEQQAQLGGSNQQQTLDYLRTRFDDRVKAVELVDTIQQHRDEYLYFHTDHHWTQLGAYYAYVEFCKVKGIEPKSLSSWSELNLGEFQGTYYDTIEAMGYVAPDEVQAWVPADTNDMTYWTSYGDEISGKVVNDEAASWEPSYKYSAFIAGDQPLEVIRNPKVTDGSSCLVVKDSYGCAFVPELVDHYETVHVIDFRDTDKNLVDYVKKNGIQDVIFLTGMKIGLTDTVAQTLLAEVAPTTSQGVLADTMSAIRSRAHGA